VLTLQAGSHREGSGASAGPVSTISAGQTGHSDFDAALGGTWPGVEFYSTVAQLVPALIAGFALYAHYTDTPAARRIVYVATFASIAVLFTCLGVLWGPFP
jgi:hypothetical protein